MANEIFQVEDLKVYFKLKKSFVQDMKGNNKNSVVKAVDGVTFDIREKEILSLVGESGSGKTTTGKALLKLVESQSQKMIYKGEELKVKNKEAMSAFRQSAQMIFQDPYQSLNPRMRIIDIVAEPLDVNHLIKTEEERVRRAKEALENAGLSPGEDYFLRYPYELSGGQRQRVVIASSMIMNPNFVVADEPVSMLDASIRTGILKLMLELREKNNLAYLFITHDLSLAWLISDRIAIMYLGKIMEIGTADQVIKRGLHPYTKALVEIMPKPGQKIVGERKVLEGETPNPAEEIQGCKFCSRCPIAEEICKKESPKMKEVEAGHSVACHLI